MICEQIVPRSTRREETQKAHLHSVFTHMTNWLGNFHYSIVCELAATGFQQSGLELGDHVLRMIA